MRIFDVTVCSMLNCLYRRLRFSQPGLQVVLERDCLIVFLIVSALEQHDVALAGRLQQRLPGRGLPIQLLEVTLLELLPLRRVMAEPTAQRSAGRYISQPPVDLQGLLADAARP